jgi:hypothetical protein
MWAVLPSHSISSPLIQLRLYLEGCTRRCPRLVTMSMMMELRPMLDIRLMGTCLQFTVITRCTRRATTNGVYLSLDHLDQSAGVLGLGQRVRALCHSHSLWWN